MNRLDRITAILIQLQSKKVVKAQDIANRFDISLRTVYRDINSLEEAGVPIIGEAGVGYTIMDGYRLPPVMFTKEEAIAFLTAEKLASKLTDNATANYYKDAMYKVRSVLRSEEKGFLENVDNAIQVYKYAPQGLPNNMYKILKSINDKTSIAIEYFANYTNKLTQRTVEPVGIYYTGNYWHLIAWCNMRNDYRDFRLDRIKKLQNTTTPIAKHEKITLLQYMEDCMSRNNLIKIVVSFSYKVLPYIQGQKYYNGFISEEPHDTGMRITFLTSSLFHFSKWIVSFGAQATVIEPSELIDEIKNHIEELNTHYQ